MRYSERHARLKLILREEGLEKLFGATVLVLGLGGVGSACAEALARGGVGRLVILDCDVIEESNINRQALAFSSTLGRRKPEVMAEMIHEINPDCQVTVRDIKLMPDNVSDVLSALPRPDYVLDCIDTISQKLAVAQWCAERGIYLLSAMGAANKLDPSHLRVAQIRRTQNCPMAKVIRHEALVRGIRGIEVLYSAEEPVRVANPGARTKGETLGSISYMPPIMGQMMAGVAIRRLAGLEPFPNAPRMRKETADA